MQRLPQSRPLWQVSDQALDSLSLPVARTAQVNTSASELREKRVKNPERVMRGLEDAIRAVNRILANPDASEKDLYRAVKQKEKLVARNFRTSEKIHATAPAPKPPVSQIDWSHTSQRLFL